MCALTCQNENRVLIVSALLASGFAVGGLILGWLVGSLVILFDGVYSSVSLLLTLLSLAASRYIQTPEKNIFPFGKAVLEPVVIAIKATVILAVVAFSLHSAIIALFNGGREVDTSIATLFGLINVVGCGFAWWYIARRSRRHSSGLIEAEARQWQMDTLLSVAVTLGFVCAWLLTQTSAVAYAVYADPLMMCLMSVYFIKVPYEMLRDALRELLMMSPDQAICDKVNESVRATVMDSRQQVKLAGVTKVGRELRVNVSIHPDTDKVIVVDDIERTRRSLTRRLSALPFELQLNLSIAA